MTSAATPSARAEHLERRRRDVAADYAKAARRHAPRAALATRLVRATCDVLREEIRAARRKAQARRIDREAEAITADLFGERP
jgi:hypothetical protein